MSNNSEMPLIISSEESDDGRKEAAGIFAAELQEVTTNLEGVLIALEKNPGNKEMINTAFRSFHNLKGSSSMMGYNVLKDICHYSEGLLDKIRSGQMQLQQDMVDLFMEALSNMREVGQCLVSNGTEGTKRYFLLLHKLSSAAEAQDSEETKTTVEKEDPNNPKNQGAAEAKKSDDEIIKVNREQVDVLMLLVGEFIGLKNRALWLGKNYGKDRKFLDLTEELEHFSQKLQRNVLKLRLSSVGQVLEGMRRVVRATARKLNKAVDLEIEGQDVQLDRSILDVLSEPLMHMMRNSVDHGIENVQERIEKSKPETGKIYLKASYVGGDVHVSIADDGKGIDPIKIRDKVLEKGLVKESALMSMSRHELIQLIFLPGFSSADAVTETSGRGVGMDVVKQTIQSVGGEVDVTTEIGVGTTITLKLPLSMSILESLSFEVLDQAYSIPQVNVEEVYSLDSQEVRANLHTLPGGGMGIMVRESSIPVVNLSRLFFDREEENHAIIQVRLGKKRFALAVRKIIGPLSVLSQPLPADYCTAAPFSGITTRGDGSILFQLDVEKLSHEVNSFVPVRRRSHGFNRGAAGESQAANLMTSSDIRRLQQKVITFRCLRSFCIPVQRIKRTEYLLAENIQTVFNKAEKRETAFVTLGNSTVRILWLERLLLAAAPLVAKHYSLVVFEHDNAQYGIPTAYFDGIKRLPEAYETTLAEPGILGSTVLDGETTLLLDLAALVELEHGTYEKRLLASATGEQKKRKLLVAEDDKFFATELVSTLVANNFEVVTCLDGQEAKERLEDTNFARSLYCVITDIEMPNLNGLQLVRWAKSVAHLKNLPFLAYTAISTPDMQKKMMQAGALDFFSKMSFEPLLKRLGNLDATPQKEKTLYQVTDNESSRLVSFYLGSHAFCLSMDLVKQVSPLPSCATVPKAKEWSSKLTFFRGAAIPVLDLRSYFGLNCQEQLKEQVVVEWSGRQLALFVDRVGEVLNRSQLSEGDGFPSHSISEQKVATFVRAVFAKDGNVIMYLNAQKLSMLVFNELQSETAGVAA